MHLSFADVDVDIVGSEVIMLWNVMDGQAAQKRNKNISRKRKRGAEKDLYTKCILHYIDGIFTRVSIQVFFMGGGHNAGKLQWRLSEVQRQACH